MYGLLGRKLEHSLSPQIHSLFGSYTYGLFCREENELDSFFSDTSVEAFNVTIPYKVEAFKRCDELSPIAEKIGSVNTVIRRKDGTLYGDNTDYFGFVKMAEKYDANFNGKKVLVLGSGGASRTVVTVAEDCGAAEVVIISRNGENNYKNLEKHYDADIIVNTTPVGMFPNNGESLIDLTKFNHLDCVLDLIYNPLKTPLLLDAQELSIKNGNGLYMLVAQGLRSSEMFTGKKLNDELIEKAYNKLIKETQNIIFIGMPGSGKTTIGRLIAEKLNKKFVDTDEEVEKKVGKKIPKIFSENGEEFFRKTETEIVMELTKKLGCVIATGGGIIEKKENRSALLQNGLIIYLKRDFLKLDRKGRPLSSSLETLQMLYDRRRSLYESIADFTIQADDEIEKTAERVIECLSL